MSASLGALSESGAEAEMRIVMLLCCLGLSVYGLHCAFHMYAFIGTGHYWSNPWFYKAHACLFALIALRIMTLESKR